MDEYKIKKNIFFDRVKTAHTRSQICSTQIFVCCVHPFFTHSRGKLFYKKRKNILFIQKQLLLYYNRDEEMKKKTQTKIKIKKINISVGVTILKINKNKLEKNK